MGLTGKMVKQVEIKYCGDVFHELFSKKQHDVSKACPGRVHGCELHHGQRGEHGHIICWDYTHDGKRKRAKQIVEPEYEKNSIKFTMIEGDLMELYKTFIITIHVDKNGEDNLVTWTTEYEKLSEDIEDPASLMEFFGEMTREIENHHQLQSEAAGASVSVGAGAATGAGAAAVQE